MTHALLDRAATSMPYGDVSYADPGLQKDKKKRYPLDSEAHCRAAWSYINQADNAVKYTPEQLASIKAKIKAAGKKYGIEFSDSGRSAGLDLCVRSFAFESRATSGDGRTLEGYAAVYDTPARIRDLQGDFDEVIRPGAFTRSLSKRTPVMQWDHGKDPRVGTVPIGAFEEINPEDRHGLYVRARLFDNPVVEPVRQAIAAGAVRGMSFRFEVPREPAGDTWTRRSGEPDLREIRDADTYELGPVVHPAYDSTSVSVRSLLAQLDPAEHRAMLHELAAHLGLAVDLTPPAGVGGENTDLSGRSDARSAGGADPDTEPGHGAASPAMHLRQRLDEGALRARGILR